MAAAREQPKARGASNRGAPVNGNLKDGEALPKPDAGAMLTAVASMAAHLQRLSSDEREALLELADGGCGAASLTLAERKQARRLLGKAKAGGALEEILACARLRPPNVVIVGGMKCGTTSLHHYLHAHPQIAMSSHKELNFFGSHRHFVRGWLWYLRQFDPTADVRGEASPNYTKDPVTAAVAAERMSVALPGVRLIYLVRDPVERLISHYIHSARRKEFTRSLADVIANPDSAHVQRGLYFANFEPYLDRFPRKSILVVAAEDLQRKRLGTLVRIFDFLNVAPRFKSPIFGKTYRTAGVSEDERPQLLRGQRDHLTKLFAPDAERLREFSGQTFASWSV